MLLGAITDTYFPAVWLCRRIFTIYCIPNATNLDGMLPLSVEICAIQGPARHAPGAKPLPGRAYSVLSILKKYRREIAQSGYDKDFRGKRLFFRSSEHILLLKEAGRGLTLTKSWIEADGV